MTRKKGLKTPEEVRAEFESRGEPIAEWARQNGFPPLRVYDVVQGRTLGVRGEAHRIAVALGIKQGEAQPVSR